MQVEPSREVRLRRILSFHLRFLRAELGSLADLARITEEFLGSQARNVRHAHEAQETLHLSVANRVEADKLVELEAIFPDILRSSLLVSALALLEGALFRICLEAQETLEQPFSIEDLKGTGLRQSLLYLEKAAGLAAPLDSSAWQQVKRLSKVRNYIVHANRTIQSQEKRAEIAGIGGVSVNQRGEIYLDDSFLQPALDSLSAFLDALEEVFC